MVSIIKREKYFLLILYFCSLALNIFFFHFCIKPDKDYLRGDSPAYYEVASQIDKGYGITHLDGRPHAYRVPGYAFFLACTYKFFWAQCA